MFKIKELLRQRYSMNLSFRAIAQSLKIGLATVQDYIKRAQNAGVVWPLPEDLKESELHAKLFPPPAVKPESLLKPAPDWTIVRKELAKKGVTLKLLWIEYRDQFPDGMGYTSFCNGYKKYYQLSTPVMRQPYKAGEMILIDYTGTTMSWVDIETGESHVMQVFVAVLGASDYIFAEPSPSQQKEDWLKSHIRMFKFFGGVPVLLIPDNLRSAITKSHRYDPDTNPDYQLFCDHYGVAIIPARAMRPQDKAKAEAAVKLVTNQAIGPLRNHKFTSSAELKKAFEARMVTINTQQFQKKDVTRKELFIEIDKPALKPLPLHQFQVGTWRLAKVHVDYHIEVDKRFYSVSYKYIKKPVKVRTSGSIVEIYFDGVRIATHIRSDKKFSYTTLKEHMPEAHKAQSEVWTAQRFISWANTIGPNTAGFIKVILESRTIIEQTFKGCLGVLKLGKKYTNVRLEIACGRALEVGMNRYTQIDNMLKNNLDQPKAEDQSNQSTPEHANIRGSEYFI